MPGLGILGPRLGPELGAFDRLLGLVKPGSRYAVPKRGVRDLEEALRDYDMIYKTEVPMDQILGLTRKICRSCKPRESDLASCPVEQDQSTVHRANKVRTRLARECALAPRGASV